MIDPIFKPMSADLKSGTLPTVSYCFHMEGDKKGEIQDFVENLAILIGRNFKGEQGHCTIYGSWHRIQNGRRSVL